MGRKRRDLQKSHGGAGKRLYDRHVLHCRTPATSTTTSATSQTPSCNGTIPSGQESTNMTQSQLLMIPTARPMNTTWNSKGTPRTPRAPLGDGSLFHRVGSIDAHKITLVLERHSRKP